MNRLIVFLIVMVSGFQTFSQTVMPLYSDNPTWKVFDCTFGGCGTNTETYSYDTTFCGYTWSKYSPYLYYVRADSVKAYARYSINCNDREYLVMDFSSNQNVGDTLYFGYGIHNDDSTLFRIEKIDSVDLKNNNQYRKRITYTFKECPPNSVEDSMVMIYGIGSTTHPFYFQNICQLFEHSYSLLCMDTGTTNCYKNNFNFPCDTTITVGIEEKNSLEGFKIFPSPATDKLTIQLPENTQTFSLTNLTGKRITSKNYPQEKEIIDVSTLKPGTYFIQVIYKNQTYSKKIIVLQ